MGRKATCLMKAGLVLIGVATVFVTASGFAGPQEIIKQRARELRDQNNVRQGVAPPTQAATPPPGATTAATAQPAVSPALTKLQADLATIKTGSQVTPAQKQQLTQDLLAVAQGTKPATTAPKLAEDLANACAEKQLSPANRSRLVQEIDAVLNPTKYPSAKMDGIFADVQAIFQEREDNPMAASSRRKAQVIAEDVKAMSAEVQRGGAK